MSLQLPIALTGETSGLSKVSGGDTRSVYGLNISTNYSVSLGFDVATMSTGTSNTLVGYAAAQKMQFGSLNTILGFMAGRGNNADGNTLIGHVAGMHVNAPLNTMLGTRSGLTCTSGARSVLVGAEADTFSSTTHDATAVGFGAVAAQSAVALGTHAMAQGADTLALGQGTQASGRGSFNIANRLYGHFVDGAPASASMTTYAVEVRADATVLDGALALRASGEPRWMVSLQEHEQSNIDKSFDLVFKSSHRAAVRFTDDFFPGVLDFTAQHRCAWGGPHDDFGPGLAGKVVVATGSFRDLEGRNGVRGMDEALPVVDLCRAARDPRVFGVVSSVEPLGISDHRYERTFKVGNIEFSIPASDRRVIVNGGGEGAVWLCDENGMVSNGDLLCASKWPGLAMRQDDDIVRACTLGKITCDCTFDSVNPDANGVRIKLVGCTYK